MPTLSLRRILIFMLIVLALAKLDWIMALIAAICRGIYDSFEPLRNCSAEWKYAVMCFFLFFIYVNIIVFLRRRR